MRRKQKRVLKHTLQLVFIQSSEDWRVPNFPGTSEYIFFPLTEKCFILVGFQDTFLN